MTVMLDWIGGTGGSSSVNPPERDNVEIANNGTAFGGAHYEPPQGREVNVIRQNNLALFNTTDASTFVAMVASNVAATADMMHDSIDGVETDNTWLQMPGPLFTVGALTQAFYCFPKETGFPHAFRFNWAGPFPPGVAGSFPTMAVIALKQTEPIVRSGNRVFNPVQANVPLNLGQALLPNAPSIVISAISYLIPGDDIMIFPDGYTQAGFINLTAIPGQYALDMAWKLGNLTTENPTWMLTVPPPGAANYAHLFDAVIRGSI